MDGSRQSDNLIPPNLTPGKSRRSALASHSLTFLVKNRRVVVAGIVLLMILFEILEHAIIINLGDNLHTVYDIVLFVGVVPIATWLVLRRIGEIESEREQARVDNDLHNEFSQKLGNATTWDDLVRQIVAYPHRVAPRANIILYVFNPDSLNLQPEAACTREGHVTLKPQVSLNPDSLPVGSLPQLLMQNGVRVPVGIVLNGEPVPANGSAPARHPAVVEPPAPPLPAHRYDLPITRNEQQIGVLKLEYPLGIAPTPDEVRALKSAAPVMALALEGALLQNLAAEQAAASEAQRQQVAQTLHDTLAQNISYLRLKLDQLTGENAIREIGAVLQELERMRATADEAYQQVRNTLDELNPIQGENLVSTLFKQARTISARAGFDLRTSQAGTSRTLSAATRQQILYIVREALYNIEKHACAHQVHLAFLWLEAELIIKITDDGIGFNPISVPSDGHYGLWIMQQRAQEIGGTLKIGPADDGSGSPGTEVTLWVPYPVS